MKYRMLKKGEIIRKGDEFFYCGEWRKDVPDDSIGAKFCLHFPHVPYRRPIPARRKVMPKTCGECPIKEACILPGCCQPIARGSPICHRAWRRLRRYLGRTHG